jgi:hypothetical protein
LGAKGELDMAQLNVRFPDDFYKHVKRIVYMYLEMDLSSFVRELFIDTILLYEGGGWPLTVKALAAIGQKHRIKGGPALLLTMADHWREAKKFARQLDKEPTEEEKKLWSMSPEEQKDFYRKRGMPERMIEQLVLPKSDKEMIESFLANDPELARIDKMTEEEREKYLMENARARMLKARKSRAAAVKPERKLKGKKV